jgi:hypothetical protein
MRESSYQEFRHFILRQANERERGEFRGFWVPQEQSILDHYVQGSEVPGRVKLMTISESRRIRNELDDSAFQSETCQRAHHGDVGIKRISRCRLARRSPKKDHRCASNGLSRLPVTRFS